MNSTYFYLGMIAVAIFVFMVVIGSKISKLKANIFFIGFFAVVAGLLVGTLAYLPLSRLPGIYGVWTPVIFYIASVAVSVWLFLSRQQVITQTFENLGKIMNLVSSLRPQFPSTKPSDGEVLVDTSVLIDGRIVGIAKAGFVPGRLIVPRFILSELQNIADSEDSLRRERGRLGLDVLEELKKSYGLKIVSVPEEIKKNSDPADEKLMQLAKILKASVLTNDFNLNKVAKVENVKVLNVNELSQAIRPVLIPGEELEVKIVQEGKEKDQGVGYLPDGTMIVVENGGGLAGKSSKVEIKRVIQTAAGKMYFAVLKSKSKNSKPAIQQKH